MTDLSAAHRPDATATDHRKAGPPLLEMRGIGKTFDGETVLDHVDLAVARGEIVTLIGPNGSGKSTLAKIAIGLLDPDEGTVQRAPGLRVGYVPQRLTIDRTLPLSVSRFMSLEAHHDRRTILAALEALDAADVVDKPMQALSGGETQRVLLARAALNEPDILILDEPAQAVDHRGQAEVYAHIRELRDRLGCGVLVISHDLHLVMSATDHVVCLNHHVCCTGQPEAIRRDPAFLELFGRSAAAELAIYTHHHDHDHALSGAVLGDEGHSQDHGHGHGHGHGHDHG